MTQQNPPLPLPLIESDDCLKNNHLYWSQWMITRNVRDIGSRREWLDEMSLTFINCPEFGFEYRDGTPYEFPDIDEVFGDDEDMRWLSLYNECDGSNLYPRRISSKIERLRLLNLFLKMRYPKLRPMLEVAGHA